MVGSDNNDATDSKKVVKFKKRARIKEKKKNLAQRKLDGKGSISNDDDDDDDGDGDVGVMNKILEKKRRRKLLEAKRGIDVEKELNTISKDSSNEESLDENGARKSENRPQNSKGEVSDGLRGTFSGVERDLASSDAPDGDQTIRKKHMMAMEEYVRKNIEIKEEKQEDITIKKVSPEDKLYQELLQDASESVDAIPEADIGSGGAMLGGTGIAEVLLPSHKRFSQPKAKRYENHRKSENKTTISSELEAQLPMNFRKGPAKSRNIKTTNTSNFESSTSAHQEKTKSNNLKKNTKDIGSHAPSSYSQNFKLHKQKWNEQQRKKEKMETNDSETQKINNIDQDRLGFQALRSKNNDIEPNATSQAKKKEEKYWSQFVSKQRSQFDTKRPFY